MSLILDALNRSRSDTDEVPGLATEHYLEQDAKEAGNLRRYLPWLALLAALLVIAWLLLDRGGQTGVPVSDPGSAAPTVSKSAASGEGAGPPAPPPQALAEPVVETAVPPSTPRVLEPAPVPAGQARQIQAEPTPEPAPKSEPGAAVADLYQRGAREPTGASAEQPVKEQARQPAAPAQPRGATGAPVEEVAAGSPEEQAVDIGKMVLKARDELKNTRLAEHPAPFILELSQQTKDSIPTIYYERHDYSGEASRSLVVLNGKQLRVGGSPAAGLKVDEILPDSVVLNYRGTQFRLRALNSWINL